MVWNKNRPTPPPPVKQFTDEELKQQFGIHMATRLQADEDQKESKWADIDEDEDENWAPETVEWMDGTKSTVKPAEPTPPPEEPQPEAKKEDKPAEESKPATPSLSRPSSTGPSLTGGTKTILKPGAHSGIGGNRQGGLLSKGQMDGSKPTLVSKSPAPTPAKSPWAPLPPVEKVSPIVVNPLSEHPPISRFSQKDPHGFDALPPAPSPAKEIAADDFNRSWRDDRGPRELFNSQSGRYEPGSLTQQSSPVAAHVQPASPLPADGSLASPDAANGGANPVVAYQEQVKVQEQMMRDKIERARAEKQKRREEEEKEEAARKERLRLKLEALGPPPSKAEKPKSPPAASETPHAQQKPTAIQSPPKPPIPTVEGEVAQYGMMKVHQPHPVKRAGEHFRASEQTRREVKSPERKAVSPVKSADVPAAEAPKPDSVSSSEEAAPTLEQKVPAWKPSVASGTPWVPLRSRNVWGPPNQERGIGNGTFGHTQQPPPAGAPGPIAPPPATTKLPTSPPRFSHPPSAEQPSSTFASQPDLRSQDSFAHTPTAMASAAVAPPGPIGPPKPTSRPAFDVSAWSANSIAESDAKLARRREESYQANRGKPLPAFNETFKQTAIEGSLDRRRVLETKSTVHLHPTSVSKPEDQALHTSHSEPSSRSTPVPLSEPYRPSVGEEASTLRPIGAEKVQTSPGSTGAQGNRSSRFFPRTQDALDTLQATVSQLTINGDSPPPPETSSHPVFTGDVSHPIVKLPQKIKVKLPPAVASNSSSPVIMPARPGFSRLGSQPIISQPSWQERFNGLLGRASAPMSSPPKTATSLAVASASKAPYDHTGPLAGATVSLPSKPAPTTFASSYDASPVSKSAFEEVMSVPEAFSAPTVRLPKEPHMNAGLAPVAAPSIRPGSRFYKTTDVFSIDPTFSPVAEREQNAQGFIITIHMAASDVVKTRIMPRRRNPGRKPSGYNNKKRSMPPRENSNSNGAPRPRKTSGNVPPGHPWSNNSKSNSPSSPWGRRASGAVH
ncbi:hypothetical protein SLS55_008749 [Diplodia seriata]|uniref:Uncharacterized protein n=1 Tax=Diplodia seriata TaxID=420778 RepID=A0ABR3C6W6_9PEZI